MLVEIQEEIKQRKITRLCHFVHTNKLLYILHNSDGINAVDFISKDTLDQNDTQRLDGKTDFINCSIQYPNWWYLRRVKENNPIFSDWAILFIDPIVATFESTEFCKMNAAKRYGAYIKKGYKAFQEIFEQQTGSQFRTPKMLPNAPTDDQAEVLVYQSIPVEYITGIAFENAEIARQKIVEWQVIGAPIKDVYIAPALFDVSSSKRIRNGQEPIVMLFKEV